MDSNDGLKNIILPLLTEMGLSLVDLSVGKHRGEVKINLVLYKESGIGLDDLTSAQKILRPRLELEYNRDGLSVEISSPGMGRVLKSELEYEIFIGRNIKLLNGDDWISGVLKGTENKNVILETDGQDSRYPISDIRKAKLD